MELNKFLQLLRKHRFLLIAVPFIAVISTFFLTRKLPDTYSSKARLATGLVDQSQKKIIDNLIDPQEAQINLQFSNLIQLMQLKK